MKTLASISILLGTLCSSIFASPSESYGPAHCSLKKLHSTSTIAQGISPDQTKVKIFLSDGLAQEQIEQVFVNPTSDSIEIAYVFPLPERGAVHGMSYTVKNKTQIAKIYPKDEAQKLYQTISQSGQQASLLTQERPNIFTQKFANLGPGDTVRINMIVSHPLKYDLGTYELAFPTMVADRYLSDASVLESTTLNGWNPPAEVDGSRLSISVYLEANSLYSLSSPTHDLSQVSGTEAKQKALTEKMIVNPNALLQEQRFLELKPLNTYPNKDFVLRFKSVQDQGGLLVNSWQDQDTGYFALSLHPDLLALSQRPNLEVVFLVDRSGSQSGWPLQKEKEITLRLLDKLTLNDRLQVIAFDTQLDYLNAQPAPVTPTLIESAKNMVTQIYTRGGTDLLAGIRASLAQPLTPNYQRIYVFLTDGFITNDTLIIRELKNSTQNLSIFTFGAGDNLNRYFLEEAAKVGNGFASIATSTEDAGLIADQAWDKISGPQLSQIQLQFEGPAIYDTLLPVSKRLYQGLPFEVYGKYLGSSHVKLTLNALKGSSPFQQIWEFDLANKNANNWVVPKIWARNKLAQLDLLGSVSKNEMIQVSLTHQVLCQYTAFLAFDASLFPELAQQDTYTQLNTMPLVSSVLEDEIQLESNSIGIQDGKINLRDLAATEILLINAQGKILFNSSSSDMTHDQMLDLNSYKSGIYFLWFKTATGWKCQKISWEKS